MNKSEKDFIVTADDEKIVEDLLRDFVLPEREEVKVYQPVIFTETPKTVSNFQVFSSEENTVVSSKEELLVSEESFIYYDRKAKKISDFLFGFIVVLAMFYFLNFQPLIIFLIYFMGMIQATWAFKLKRLFIVWGFIFGAIVSMFFAMLVYVVLQK